MKKQLHIFCAALLLTSCTGADLYNNKFTNPPQLTEMTETGKLLAALPAPKRQIPVVVYDFQDQTGQFRNNGLYTDYSSAVTKGGLSILTKALLDTGHGHWFTVAERNGLNDLIKERQIIRTMRSDYTRPDGSKLPDLPPLIYGGMLLEGSIVFYDSNVITGGAAAGYFGITGSTEYHRDIVTIYMRAVDINTGKVILAVNSSKTIFSYGANAGIVHYLSYNRLLEAETGYSVNEPSQIAVSQAIEAGLYSLIMEGAQRNLWSFSDEVAGKTAMGEYLKRKNASDDSVSASAESAPEPKPAPAAAAPAAPAAPVTPVAAVPAAPAPLPVPPAQAQPAAPAPQVVMAPFGRPTPPPGAARHVNANEVAQPAAPMPVPPPAPVVNTHAGSAQPVIVPAPAKAESWNSNGQSAQQTSDKRKKLQGNADAEQQQPALQ